MVDLGKGTPLEFPHLLTLAPLLSFIGNILDLSGGNIFGMVLGSLLVLTFVRLVYVCAAAWAVVGVLGDLRRDFQKDWMISVLAVAVVLVGGGIIVPAVR